MSSLLLLFQSDPFRNRENQPLMIFVQIRIKHTFFTLFYTSRNRIEEVVSLQQLIISIAVVWTGLRKECFESVPDLLQKTPAFMLSSNPLSRSLSVGCSGYNEWLFLLSPPSNSLPSLKPEPFITPWVGPSLYRLDSCMEGISSSGYCR